MRLRALIVRNIKLFFCDRGLFFTALITPLVLLLLFIVFLENAYGQMFESIVGIDAVPFSLQKIFITSYQFSSLLGVSCITVAFCTNLVMVHDKVTHSRQDLLMTPVPSSFMTLGYFIASELSILFICLFTMTVGVAYLSQLGWIMPFDIVLKMVGFIILLTMFGTTLSSIISLFLSSQGQITAVTTIVSSAYGFICGAYIPISELSEQLHNIVSILPGTFGTNLIRRNLMGNAMDSISNMIGADQTQMLADTFDYNLYFCGAAIGVNSMVVSLIAVTVIMLLIYIFMSYVISAKKMNKEICKKSSVLTDIGE